MINREKRLLRIMLFIFIAYMLPFQIAPVTYHYYSDYRESIDRLHHNIERYTTLGRRAEYWKTDNQRAKKEHEEIEAGLLSGKTRELMGANLQSLVRKLAKNKGITSKSLDPPDTSFSTGEWVLVIQSMQLEASSRTLMAFLKAINENKVNLEIVSLDIRSYRKKLTGTIKITAFSHLASE
ncbi:MAG: hypothetical protein KAI83_01640 [Thiomargarita sp.]|nr:hypothetical protein [Thiomargarita sp.]